VRRTALAVASVVAAAGFTLAVAAPAVAHNAILSTTPGEDSVLTELPDAWEVVTSDTLLYIGNDEVFGMWVRDAEGLYYGDGCVDVSGPRMTAEPAIGVPGEYTLEFAFISADGHPTSAAVPFEWAPVDAAAVPVAAGSAEPARCGAAAPASPEPSEEPSVDDFAAALPWNDLAWATAAVVALLAAVLITTSVARRRL
jgi:methionine-rich copper-binding protein CopC